MKKWQCDCEGILGLRTWPRCDHEGICWSNKLEMSRSHVVMYCGPFDWIINGPEFGLEYRTGLQVLLFVNALMSVKIDFFFQSNSRHFSFVKTVSGMSMTMHAVH
jgi:hypothetical protein